ncbi:hypothetical protein Leryth_017101 [Lithospermum erythrorhizon]|nr:hypothetical protein Leryth_017101 [Lithospermum erythrorhizon]
MPSQKRYVVLVPAPLQGHITPILQLGTILESRGFSIIVAHSDYNAPDPKNHPSFSFLSLSDDEVASYDKSFQNMLMVLVAMNKKYRAKFRDYLVDHMIQNKVEVEDEDEDADGVSSGRCVIIYDRIMYCADEVAKELKIPSIVMRPYSSAYELSRKIVLHLKEVGCLPLPETQIEDMVPELQPFRYKDLPFPQFTTLAMTTSTNNDGIPEAVTKFWEVTHSNGSSQAVIWNTMEEIESEKTLSVLEQYYQIPFFCIAPIHKMAPQSLKTSLFQEDNSCVEWLDKQSPNSVLYVSLGSIATMNENELIETAWGLAKSEVPFLWVIRKSPNDMMKGNAKLPDHFEEIIGERGKIVVWAPQKEVLAHSAVGGFWSHCGWNSTMESISEGVPMICKPSFSDQRINARYVTDIWKVGLQLERSFDRGDVETIVRRLMMDGVEGNAIRKRALDFNYKFEVSMQKGGCSYESLDKFTEFISSLYM